MHFSDLLKPGTYKKVDKIKTFKDLVVYVESESIHFENILFEGSMVDFDTTYEIGEVKRQGRFLFVTTNIFGLLAKQNLIPDVYRDQIFDNRLLYNIMHVFHDASVKIIFYSLYLRYCRNNIEKFSLSLLRDDLSLPYEALINGALTISNPVLTLGKLTYLVRSYFTQEIIKNVVITSRELVYKDNKDVVSLSSFVIGSSALGTRIYFSRNIEIKIDVEFKHFDEVMKVVKTLRKELDIFCYGYFCIIEICFKQVYAIPLSRQSISHSSIICIKELEHGILVYS